MRIANPSLLLLGVALCLSANARGQHNPHGQIVVTSLADPYLVLIRDPVVHAELRLNDQQRQAIRALTDDLASRRLNTASPDDLARFVADLRRGRLLSPGSTESLLAMMRVNRTGDRRIRALLPKGTLVGDKTGTMGGSANDVGFVELPDGKGTLVVVVLVKDSTRDAAAKDRAIARAAKAAFDAFAR